MNHTLRAPSYLNARDPSLFMGVKHEAVDKKILYVPNSSYSSIMYSSTEEQEEDDTNIQVYLRIKNNIPFDDLYEIDGNTLICKVPPNSNVMRNLRSGENMTKTYTFTNILDPRITQLQLFDGIVKRKMVEFLNGINTTIFTYGASGSGKTFTIVGTAEEPGLIPRALEYIFRSLPDLSANSTVKPLPNGTTRKLSQYECLKETNHTQTLINSFISHQDRQKHIKTYKDMQQRLSDGTTAIVETSKDVVLNMWVSFAEIYNENIYDLLVQSPAFNKQRPKLSLGNVNGFTYIKDLTSVPVSSGIEAYQVLQCGIHNLNYAATAINSHSSRSHSIFTIKLVQTGSNGCKINYFNFCDLAGSERLKKTGNVGDRLKESNNINRSLMVLGRCISSIRTARSSASDSQYKLVPFRESKLTRLFQNALTGFENMSMIITMNPSLDMFDETHHVLNFSALAKDIIIEAPKRCETNSRFSKYLSEGEKEESSDNYYRNLADELQLELEAQKDEYQSMLHEEHQRLKEGYELVMKMKCEMIEKSYKEQIKQLKAEYESQLKECNKNVVIDLDSSEEEIRENSSESNYLIKELELKCAEKDQLVEQLRREIVMLKEKLDGFEQEKRKTRRLTGILSDAKIDYKAMENENMRLLKENLELREELQYRNLVNASEETD